MPDDKEQHVDAEKQQQPLPVPSDNELGKVKEKRTPTVNASLILFYAVLSGMSITGWVNLNSCPVNRMIPIYLIVAGSTGILTNALIRTKNRYVFNVVLGLVIFDFIWLQIGSYFVYKEYQPNYEENQGPYCNRVAYLLAFWMITIFNCLLGLFILLSGCYFLMRNTFKKS